MSRADLSAHLLVIRREQNNFIERAGRMNYPVVAERG